MSGDDSYRVWYRNQEACGEAIVSGRAVTVDLSDWGANDWVVNFLVTSGLWTVLTSMQPDGLRKHNGAPWPALNGIEVLRELAGVQRIAHCGKLLRNVPLMMLAGFNAQAVHRAASRGRPVVTAETLANHLARISPRSAAATFLKHVALLRRKRWLRGTTYAADAHEIIVPYGRCSQRLGKVGEKYGYKLVVVLNVTPARERVVGFVLAPLHHSERTLLRLILRGLDRSLGPVGRWMHTLILDRGYWGARYLLGLKARWGIDVVTRAQHDDLHFVQETQTLAEHPEVTWHTHRETHSHLGDMQVRCCGVPAVPVYDGGGTLAGTLNAVVAREYDPHGRPLQDESGHERPPWYYATTLPVDTPGQVRRYYGMRWTIENQGFRQMTQQWALDCLAGRKFNALNSRIAFALMLYNVDHVLRMKQPDRWQHHKQQRAQAGEQDRLSGPCIAAYTVDGSLGLYTAGEYGQLVALRERRRIVHTLREGLAHGQTLERMLDRLEHTAPREG